MIYLELFWVFFKIGLFTFGGGYAMIPFIQQEVIAKGWLSQNELINFAAVSESTPGPFAVNIATYIGVAKGGLPGGIFATFGVVLPSFIVILIVTRFYLGFKNSKLVKGVMWGIKPVAIGLIGAASFSIAYSVFIVKWGGFASLITYPFICSAVIFVFSLALLYKKKSPILAIGVSAAAGVAFGYLGETLKFYK